MLYSTLAFPAAPITTDYSVYIEDENIAYITDGCARTSSSSAVPGFKYNYIYGIPLGETEFRADSDDYLFDSSSCSSLDTGPHGEIAVSTDAIDAPHFVPYKSVVFFVTVFAFIYVLTFIFKILGIEDLLYDR